MKFLIHLKRCWFMASVLTAGFSYGAESYFLVDDVSTEDSAIYVKLSPAPSVCASSTAKYNGRYVGLASASALHLMMGSYINKIPLKITYTSAGNCTDLYSAVQIVSVSE